MLIYQEDGLDAPQLQALSAFCGGIQDAMKQMQTSLDTLHQTVNLSISKP